MTRRFKDGDLVVFRDDAFSDLDDSARPRWDAAAHGKTFVVCSDSEWKLVGIRPGLFGQPAGYFYRHRLRLADRPMVEYL